MISRGTQYALCTLFAHDCMIATAFHGQCGVLAAAVIWLSTALLLLFLFFQLCILSHLQPAHIQHCVLSLHTMGGGGKDQ